MPPQPEYVLIRDSARDLVELARRELENDRYKLVCLLTYIAKLLLRRALEARQGVDDFLEKDVEFDKIISIAISRNSREESLKCLREAEVLITEVDKFFMEMREEECGCWGE